MNYSLWEPLKELIEELIQSCYTIHQQIHQDIMKFLECQKALFGMKSSMVIIFVTQYDNQFLFLGGQNTYELQILLYGKFSLFIVFSFPALLVIYGHSYFQVNGCLIAKVLP
ncbi:hypothetical protein ACTA71_000936 [Dictyostelium dimigraforme]